MTRYSTTSSATPSSTYSLSPDSSPTNTRSSSRQSLKTKSRSRSSASSLNENNAVKPELGLTGCTSLQDGRPRRMCPPFTDDDREKLLEGGGEDYGPTTKDYHFWDNDERGSYVWYRTVYNYSDRYKFSRIVVDDCLIFDANFESGNLRSSKRVYFGDYRDDNPQYQEYDLEMNDDIQSNIGATTQWFFFSVASSCSFPTKPVTVKFNIVNFTKPDSLYNYGMKPLCYNTVDGWKRIGKGITYFANQLKLYTEKKNKQFYTLSFTFELCHNSIVNYFAACFPYTYFDLQKYLYNLQMDSCRQCFVKRDLLCESLAGNRCDLLTITEPFLARSNLVPIKERKFVVLTARVHPGESNASWMMQGIIDYLTSNVKEAYDLRSKYVFKIVPMLNPDGVINGNYRNSLSGMDLNRCWDHPDPIDHPTIYKTKEMVKSLQLRQEVLLLCDFHGHSRKEGTFVFGCVPDVDKDKKEHQNLVFPKVYDRISSYFKFDKCSFSISSKKSATMRLAMYNLGINRAYTLEASMSGTDGKHYSAIDLLNIGRDFCRALFAFSEGTVSEHFDMDIYGAHSICDQANSIKQPCKVTDAIVPNKICEIEDFKLLKGEVSQIGTKFCSSLSLNRRVHNHSNCRYNDKFVNENVPRMHPSLSKSSSKYRDSEKRQHSMSQFLLYSKTNGQGLTCVDDLNGLNNANIPNSTPATSKCSFLVMGSPLCGKSVSFGKLPTRKVSKL